MRPLDRSTTSTGGKWENGFLAKSPKPTWTEFGAQIEGTKAYPLDVFREVKIPPTPTKSNFRQIFPNFYHKNGQIFYEILGLVGGKGPRKINIKIKGQPQIFGWGGPNFQIGSHALPPGGETEVGQPNFVLLLDTILP